MPPSVSSSDELISVLLINRGVKTAKQRENFLDPKLEDYHHQLKLPGIKVAKERILKAIQNQELIVVYGDYDVDGLSATTLMYLGLASLGAKVLPYIPHRQKEGYGLSKVGLDSVLTEGAKLVITVDNGIVAIKQAEYAQKLGLEVIITDHHIPLSNLPPALAVVHSTDLSGAGVAWALIRSLVEEKLSQKLLQFVAMGTVCDLMPLVGVNRCLVKEGLVSLHRTDRMGLLSLVTECGLKVGDLSAYHLSHVLGPRLNAVGRLDSAMDALRLLCTKDPLKAKSLAKKLCEVNESKKQLTVDAIYQANQLIGSDGFDLSKKKILILRSQEWIPGIIGLMAGRMTEEYQRPAVVISEGVEISKGSARSTDGLDIVATIRQVGDCLIDVGGHPKAAGFTIATAKIPEFKRKLEQLVSKMVLEEPKLAQAEAMVNLTRVDKSWVKELEILEPFGVGNPRPVLGSQNVSVVGLRTVGGGKHLKFAVGGVEAISFGLGSWLDLLKEGQLVNLEYYLDLDDWGGPEHLQLKVQRIVGSLAD